MSAKQGIVAAEQQDRRAGEHTHPTDDKASPHLCVGIYEVGVNFTLMKASRCKGFFGTTIRSLPSTA
jgi:hypothetical protein